MAQLAKSDIEQFLDLDEQRKALNRQADSLKRQVDLLGEKITQHIVDEGGKAHRLVYRGFLLAIDLAKGTVRWKDEFIRLAGSEEADKLAAAAPPREVLVVQRAA